VTERPATPSYTNPPVGEVALAVYFSPPLELRSVHFGQLWERWRDRYPRSADQAPLPPVSTVEFGPGPTGMQVQLIAGTPGSRVWYLSEDESHVLQVQRDRLVLNWRQVAPEQEYPRYDTLRPEFEDALGKLLVFAAEEGLGNAVIRQAEVTYVNPIAISSVTGADGVAGLLAPWRGTYSDDFLPAPEDMQLLLRHRIHGENDEPIGRLFVDLRTALHQPSGAAAEPENVYLLRLFARGGPLAGGVEDAMAFLDVGHEWVVRGFTSVTTTSMQSKWGKEG